MEDAIAKTVQQLRALRQTIDRQIDECLARLDASDREPPAEETVGTPSVEVPCKRRRRGGVSRRHDVTSSEEDAIIGREDVTFPYRGDMSHWAQLFLQGHTCHINKAAPHVASLEYRLHRDDVESRAGKRQRVAYVYGNYPRYYSYRLSDPTFDEPRLHVWGHLDRRGRWRCYWYRYWRRSGSVGRMYWTWDVTSASCPWASFCISHLRA